MSDDVSRAIQDCDVQCLVEELAELLVCKRTEDSGTTLKCFYYDKKSEKCFVWIDKATKTFSREEGGPDVPLIELLLELVPEAVIEELLERAKEK